MNKSLSQAYLLQSKINDDFFIKDNYTNSKKCYDLSQDYVRVPEEIMNKKNRKIDIMNCTLSSLKYDTYSDISERNTCKSHALHEKCRNSKSSNRSHFINESLNQHNHSSLRVKNMLRSDSETQTFPFLHQTSRTWMDWKQSPHSSLNRSQTEKSDFTHSFNPFNPSISRFSSSYTCIPFIQHNDLSLKSSMRSFNSSLSFSNNNISPLNSPKKSFKSENAQLIEPLSKQKYNSSDIFPEFYSTESKLSLSKKKTYPLLKKMDYQGKPISLLHASTIYLVSVFKMCNPKFNYEPFKSSKKVLTKPNIGVKNDGYDNENNDYILYVSDILGSDRGHKYLILDILGQGTFGQVVKCRNIQTQEIVAVKVIKNKPAYFNQSMMEITILDLLNKKVDKSRKHNILQLKDTFIHKKHLCIVSELLSINLYELIKQNQFRGLNTNLVRVFAIQILDAMIVLNEEKIIHCDLKPENILLNSLESPIVKIIDFGSACHEKQTIYTYIQSRFYRSPEVLLGLPYSSSIDVWSFGCIIAELFLGLPLFPGTSEYNQIFRIIEMLGMPPVWMIEMGKQSNDFFEKVIDNTGQKTYCLKSMEQYAKEHNTVETPNKKYFSGSTLPEIIKTYPIQKKFLKSSDIDKESILRITLADFLIGLLNINPLERWSPQQAKMHPFITGNKFTKDFSSQVNTKSFSKFFENTSNTKNFMNSLLDSHGHSQKNTNNSQAYSTFGSNSYVKNDSYIYKNAQVQDSLKHFQNHTDSLCSSSLINICNQSQQQNKWCRVPYISSPIFPKDFQKYTYSNISQ